MEKARWRFTATYINTKKRGMMMKYKCEMGDLLRVGLCKPQIRPLTSPRTLAQH